MGEKQWIRKVLSGGLNTDDDIRAVEPPFPPADYTDSENTRLAAIVGGFYNSRVSIYGNTLVENTLPAGTNKSVGAYEDREGYTIINFNYNSEGNHGIYQYMANGVWTELCTGEDLAFSQQIKITGVDIIDNLLYWVEGRENPVTKECEGNPQRMLNLVKANDYQKNRKYSIFFNEDDITAEVDSWTATIVIFNPDGTELSTVEVYPLGSNLNDFLTDLADKINDETGQLTAVGCDCHLELTLTPQGKYTLTFDLEKTIDGDTSTSRTLAVPDNFYPTPVTNEYLDRIKYAPLTAPKCTFKSDPDFKQNFVAKKYFQFCTQYIYDNGEYSCISPVSKLVFNQQLCGTDDTDNPNNYVEVNFYEDRLNDSNSLVMIKKVNIYVRFGYLAEWRLVKELERCDFNISGEVRPRNIFKFYNDGLYPVQAFELVQFDNFMPLISTAQSFAQNRGYLGGNLSGYDNVDCVDASAEVSYEEPCVSETGTVVVNVFIKNLTSTSAWAGKDYQPIIGNNDSIVYGGVPEAGALVLDKSAAFQQTLELRSFKIFSPQDPDLLVIDTEQTAPAGVDLLAGDGNIYDEAGDMVALRAAMAAGEVYSTGSASWPVGKHIIRMGTNLISSDGEYYQAYPGELWFKQSLPLITVGTTGGDVTSYVTEAIIEVTAGGTVTVDIEIIDCTSIDVTLMHSLVTGYVFDGETLSTAEDLRESPNPERQEVNPQNWAGGTLLYNSAGDLGMTDHNGYFFLLYEAPLLSSTLLTIAIEGANAIEAVSAGDDFYENQPNDLWDGTALSTTNVLDINSVQERYDYILYNHYQNYSDTARTIIEGSVVNSDLDAVPGVTVLAHLTNRTLLSDSDGLYEMLVYGNRDEGLSIRTTYLLFKTGTSCCIDYPTGENKVAVVTPFTENGDYSINFPFETSAFKMDINGYDIEHWWKHRNNVKLAILYMDKAGRRGKAQPIDPLFIPFMTDEGGNEGQPVVEWLINHTPPEWAYKYQILVQQNPYYNRYLQFIVGDVEYVKLWDYSTTPPTPITTTFESGEATEISFSLLPIINYQQENTGSILGYIPEKGDRVTFIRDADGVLYTQYFDFLMESRGDNTFADPTKIVIKFNATLPEIEPGALVEMYTPKKQVETDFYYEIGELWDIGDYGLPTRYHKKGKEGQDQIIGTQPATGFIYDGDTFVRDRKMFVLDGTEPNYYDYTVEDQYIYDDDINSLQYSYGSPAIADPNFMQFFYRARTMFSGLYNTDGNKLFNGLSTFMQDSFKDADQMYGVIQRILRIGNQAQLLIIQSHKVSSWYVNQAITWELGIAEGTVSAADSPLQFGREFVSPFGTQHPESVVMDGNNVWAFDMFETVIWYHNSADLIPISDQYKYKKKIDELCSTLRQYDQDRVHVYGGLDRDFREVMWAFEAVTAEEVLEGDVVPDEDEGGVGEDQARIGGLADFDPVTIVFSIYRDKWETRLTAYPEYMVPLGGERSFMFKDGQMWESNINALTNNFFGVQYTSKITAPITALPQMIKDWYAIREKANKVWAAIEIVIPPNSRYPNGMRSRITKNNFSNFEGDLWAQFFKDMSDPAFVSETEALQRGRELKGDVMIITFENKDTVQVYLNEIDVNFTPSQETM